MANTFHSTSGKVMAFGVVNEPGYASDYITNKKACMEYRRRSHRICHMTSEGHYLLYKKGQYNHTLCSSRPGGNSYNASNLYNNLYSKENLVDIAVVRPVPIDETKIPFYENYNIDPNGSLFGNTSCGATNYLEYNHFSLQSFTPPTPTK